MIENQGNKHTTEVILTAGNSRAVHTDLQNKLSRKDSQRANQEDGMRFALIAVALILPVTAYGFEIQKSDGSTITHEGDITTITVQGATYRLWPFPAGTEQLEMFNEVADKYRGDFIRVPAGELVSSEEAGNVLEVYYRESAFDFDSMKIRNLGVPGLRYVSICDSFVVQCLRRTVHAGSLVTYEVNARNRLGPMTGFEDRKVLITRMVATEPPVLSVPARIARATVDQLKGALSEGYAAPLDKPVEDVRRATQAVLGQAGFTFIPAGSPETEFYSEPRTIYMPKLLGGGPADKALTCTSTGALEHELADKILAALH
jgi:hypothetical protein